MDATQRAVDIIGPEKVAALRQADLMVVSAHELQAQQERINDILRETERQLRGLLADLTYRDNEWEEL